MSRAAYEIQAAGEVPAACSTTSRGSRVHRPAGTTIHAVLVDEAELHGLLDVIVAEGSSWSTYAASRSTAWDEGAALSESPPTDL